MIRFTRAVTLCVLVLGVGMLAAVDGVTPFGPGQALAKAADAEKEAFEAAKELGTIEAWDAFVNNYPTGFRADLAKAYKKKLQDTAPAPAAMAAPEPPRPQEFDTVESHEISCSEERKVRSKNSDKPARITFVNKSDTYRSLVWIDFKGEQKQDYGGLNPGESKVLETFVTHPWLVATGPGDCLQIFMPGDGASVVELGNRKAKNVSKSDDDDEDDDRPKSKSKPVKIDKPPLKCAKNYKLRNGECVVVQNCGVNAYRSAEGDCYCEKNYQMREGKCLWKLDKKSGFEKDPWKKPGCKGLQAQCSGGDGKACIKYEETCQTN